MVGLNMFNIGAVSRMTNILEATLRVWERRYGFPEATRTSGGHRLYTQQDVFRLQWVKTRIDEGVQVSHAIRALQRAEEEGTFMPTPTPATALARPSGESNSLDTLNKRLINALKAHDIDEASVVISEAQSLYPLEEVILGVIGPTLHEIGTIWENGTIDIATEHLATNHVRQYLLMWMRVGPPAYAINPVVLACAPGELHEGSLLMLGVLLRRLRWPVLYLGQSMPIDDMANFVEELRPSIIVFVAMTDEPARSLLQWQQNMPTVAAKEHPIVCFGGAAFAHNPALIEQMQGEYLGDTLQEGIHKLNVTLHQLYPLLH